MGNLFTRFPAWLYNALGLQEPQVPSALDVSAILASLDVMQGGWGLMTWAISETTQPANTGAVTQEFLAPDDELVRLVWDAEFFNNRAVAANMGLILRDPISGAALNSAWGQVPANTVRMMAEMVGRGVGPLLVPPGMQLQLDFSGTNAGETQVASILVGTTRAGFKVL